jgi:hypothetical protein
MGLIYPVPFNGTITAAGTDTDIWSFQPADDKPIRLRWFTMGQISEVGDAQEEGLRITVKRLPATFTVGSGGNAVTAAAPMGSSSLTAWSFTARTNDTTVSTSSGTVQVIDEFGWNERGTPYDRVYPDAEYCPGAFQAQGLVIRMETTLADDMTFSGTAFVEELG